MATRTITPGQRLHEYNLGGDADWEKLSPGDRESYENDAARLGIQPLTEDVPPTNGELWLQAWASSEDDDEMAATFLRLVRERDGEPLAVTSGILNGWMGELCDGYTGFKASELADRINAHRGVLPDESRNVAQEQIDALVKFLSEEGKNRPLSLQHPVGSAIRYIEKLERGNNQGVPCAVTWKDIERWRADWAKNHSDREYDFYMADRINQNRGVRPAELPKVTTDMVIAAYKIPCPMDAAIYLNAELAKLAGKDGAS